MVQSQHQIASIGRKQGFLEMGIFEYPVSTDTSEELSKRIDGIISSVESGDMVFLQLPTNNGYAYENLLMLKIKAYIKTKVVLFFHNLNVFQEDGEENARYLMMCKNADLVIAPRESSSAIFQTENINHILYDSFFPYQLGVYQHNETVRDPSNENDPEAGSSYVLGEYYINKLFYDTIYNLFATRMEEKLGKQYLVDNYIHVGFGLHDKYGNYSKWIGTTIQSVMDNTASAVCFHILIDESVSDENKTRLLLMTHNNPHKVVFHLVRTEEFSEVMGRVGTFTVGALFRALLPELLPELNRIIYLDADLLFCKNIKELWDIDIEQWCVAGVKDTVQANKKNPSVAISKGGVNPEEYVNSGVLYMNLRRIREKGKLSKLMIEYLKRNQDASLPDQDAINVIFANEKLILDSSWNCFSNQARGEKSDKLCNKVFHFAGDYMQISSGSILDRRYYEMLSRTPWGQESCRKIQEIVIQRMNERIQILECILELVTKHDIVKIFYGKEDYRFFSLYKLLNVNDEDYRILMEPSAEEKKGSLMCYNVEKIKNEKRQFLIFVLPESDGGRAVDILFEMGLVENRDFFVVPKILSPQHGGYADIPLGF